MATSAVASLAATRPVKDKFVDELWKAPIPSGQGRYYDGMLYLMSLMHVSGNYRIWAPR
jgi:oligosaccharide reducing-end xylanase